MPILPSGTFLPPYNYVPNNVQHLLSSLRQFRDRLEVDYKQLSEMESRSQPLGAFHRDFEREKGRYVALVGKVEKLHDVVCGVYEERTGREGALC
jgi:DNA repair ATPase RecN